MNIKNSSGDRNRRVRTKYSEMCIARRKKRKGKERKIRNQTQDAGKRDLG